ncbi:MAG: sigma-54-dependent Fis family transcriptional regulator [Proteobacteria bacterium]|nr:sigma-54-dependent Fis family transcriptional regulator [Pseudomonadota bacterium]
MNAEKKLLVIDDEPAIREGVRRILESDSFQVETFASGYAALERIKQQTFDLVITDLKMPGISGMEVLKALKEIQPDLPVIFITGYSSVDSAVEVMKLGAVDYIAKPFTPEEMLSTVKLALEQRVVALENLYLRKELLDTEGFDQFVGKSQEMVKVYRRIMQVAPTDSTVLITGESGTGKELVARALHKHSARRDNSFVAVDCTSLAESLLESELFGHVKGSFTGAIQTKTGLFKVAEGGTLFLDEVSNLSHTTQAKLLRVLQEREVTPIGGTKPIPINIRLVVASNRNLRDMVAEGTFREDLFFRLNIIPMELPPLRERTGDIPLLVGHAVRTVAEELGKDIRGVTAGAMQVLQSYSFPGNVRELENIIERAVVLAEDNLITHDDLELSHKSSEAVMLDYSAVPQSVEELKETKRHLREHAVEDVEKAFVVNALQRNRGNITRASEETGMLRPNFQAMMKKLGISAREYVES